MLLNNGHTSIGDQGAKTCLRLCHMNSFLWPSLMLHLGQGGFPSGRSVFVVPSSSPCFLFAVLALRSNLPVYIYITYPPSPIHLSTFNKTPFFMGGPCGVWPCWAGTRRKHRNPFSVELTNKLVLGYPVQAEIYFF